MSQEQEQSPPRMFSSLPGDAQPFSPSPSPSPSPPPPVPSASSSSAAPLPALVPTAGADGQPVPVTLTSISATDPSKRRDFSALYFLPPSSSTPSSSALALSRRGDDELVPTSAEIQAAYAGQVKRREDGENRPLMTKRLREREEEEKRRGAKERWPQTKIRIRFADRSQLEGVFPSTDKLVHVYEFVRLALAEEVREKEWYLYQSPPRTEYRRSSTEYRGKTLLDLQFTPSTVFYIRFEGESEEEEAQRNDISRPPPLIPLLLSSAATLPAPPSYDSPAFAASGSTAAEVPKTAEQLKKEKEEKLKRLMGGKLGGKLFGKKK